MPFPKYVNRVLHEAGEPTQRTYAQALAKGGAYCAHGRAEADTIILVLQGSQELVDVQAVAHRLATVLAGKNIAVRVEFVTWGARVLVCPRDEP